MFLNLKGVLCGTVLFAVAAFLYIVLRMKQIGDQFPPQKVDGVTSVVGVDIRTLAFWTYRDPLFWIMFIVTVTVCSVLFQLWKAPTP